MKLYKKAKLFAKKYLRKCGFSFTRLSPTTDPIEQLIRAMEHFSINLVFDIGANEGQFASDLISSGFKGRIVSFEPLAAAHSQLVKNAINSKNWLVHDRTAIGDFDGDITFNVSANSVSSSALPILESHTSAESKSKYVDSVTVPISCLDSIFGNYFIDGDKALIKIDTQGFESKVLDGGENAINSAKCILCELSLIPLYQDQHLWQEIIDRLEKINYLVWAIQRGFTDRLTGRTMQVNGLFAKIG